jgi:outer membrane protein assembly factor BamE (lipoprotein component of BamABCDE complex)
MTTVRWHLVALTLAAASLALLTASCETLTGTTMEENQGAYFDARAFLTCGQTTREQVTAKYGKPVQITPLEAGGEHWEYRKHETVAMNAYTGGAMGTEGSMLRRAGGYQYSVTRTTVLEVFFDAKGVLAYYRLDRGTL